MILGDLSDLKSRALDGLKKLRHGSLGKDKSKDGAGLSESLPGGGIECSDRGNGDDSVRTRSSFICQGVLSTNSVGVEATVVVSIQSPL